jgi:deoxycytidylate deaminase
MNKQIIMGIARCVELAQNSQLTHKHGAITLDKSKRILSVGFNSRSSSWIQRLYAKKLGVYQKKYNHAEVDALRKADNPYYLLVVRVNNKGELLQSKPCPICQSLAKDSGVKKIYYSTKDGIQCLTEF